MVTKAPTAAGSAVQCAACGNTKAPRGRSVALGAYYCDSDCPGYACQPLPGSLWPGETRAEFGYACSTASELVGIGPVWEPTP